MRATAVRSTSTLIRRWNRRVFSARLTSLLLVAGLFRDCEQIVHRHEYPCERLLLLAAPTGEDLFDGPDLSRDGPVDGERQLRDRDSESLRDRCQRNEWNVHETAFDRRDELHREPAAIRELFLRVAA